MALEAIRYDGERLCILNQLLLPAQTVYEAVSGPRDAWEAIKTMKVRGAPAIAIVGTLSVALELKKELSALQDGGSGRDGRSGQDIKTEDERDGMLSLEAAERLQRLVCERFDYLTTARPTAVNIAEAANRFKKQAGELTRVTVPTMSGNRPNETLTNGLLPRGGFEALVRDMESILSDDITTNRAIGNHGARDIVSTLPSEDEKATILTHCNTGSLATGGYGTALGVIRSLKEMGRLQHVYCTETRPYNQGARLTAYELVHDNIPATLVCDSMAALLMRERKVSAVVVGADRVVRNGDTANKIGTYQLAIVAKHHDVPFYVASPMSTVDFSLATGDEIVLEQRPHSEMFFVGGQRVAADGIGCWNPAFDVTPAALITGGVVTERGVYAPGSLPSL